MRLLAMLLAAHSAAALQLAPVPRAPDLSITARPRNLPVRCMATEPPAPDTPADPISRIFDVLFPGGRGERIFFGVFKQSVDPASVPDDAERARLKAQAAVDLVNIDDAERERRRVAGLAMSAATAALAVGLLLADAGATARLAIAPRKRAPASLRPRCQHAMARP